MKASQLMNKGTIYGSVGIFDLLLITFVVLKLLKVINWSWWIVLLPFWGQYALTALLAIIILIVKFISKRKKRS